MADLPIKDRSYEAVLYGLLYASLEEHRRIHAPTIRVTKPHYGAIVDGEPVLDTHLDVYSESTGITFRITVERIKEDRMGDELAKLADATDLDKEADDDDA